MVQRQRPLNRAPSAARSAPGHRAGPRHCSVPFRGPFCRRRLRHPPDADQAAVIIQEIRAEQDIAGRTDDIIHVFGDLVVFLDDTVSAAQNRKSRLDEQAGQEYCSDALVFTGTPRELANLLEDWHRAGLSGFRLRPGTIPYDLEAITRRLVPELQQRGAFRAAYARNTLRGLLGLSRPANRYANV